MKARLTMIALCVALNSPVLSSADEKSDASKAEKNSGAPEQSKAAKRTGTPIFKPTNEGSPMTRLGGATRMGLHTWYSHGSAQPRRVVKRFSSLAWSPDNKTLAFSSDMDPSGAFYVYTINAGGGDPQRLDRTKSAWPQQIMWRPQQPEAGRMVP